MSHYDFIVIGAGVIGASVAHHLAVLGAQSVQSISVWGSDSPNRELLHVNDPGSAALALLDADGAEGVFNIGYGRGHCNRGSRPSRL
ncbi:NAD-dependent epimerase/dehydratase family protein [Paraburkholderia tuberum]|uniref:NAD-dependent epimerase/dehydratase family protein n=1 Tax=Paraburkholderia TaxID=1822464 RepID=UPI0003A67EF1|nr:NAD-dependent epimerase/dehydratase family protein [Paraburkholderia tuberum]